MIRIRVGYGALTAQQDGCVAKLGFGRCTHVTKRQMTPCLDVRTWGRLAQKRGWLASVRGTALTEAASAYVATTPRSSAALLGRTLSRPGDVGPFLCGRTSWKQPVVSHMRRMVVTVLASEWREGLRASPGCREQSTWDVSKRE